MNGKENKHGHTRDLDRPLTYENMVEDTAAIIISASGQENVRQENRRFAISLSYIFLSAGFDGRNDDQGLSREWISRNR